MFCGPFHRSPTCYIWLSTTQNGQPHFGYASTLQALPLASSLLLSTPWLETACTGLSQECTSSSCLHLVKVMKKPNAQSGKARSTFLNHTRATARLAWVHSVTHVLVAGSNRRDCSKKLVRPTTCTYGR